MGGSLAAWACLTVAAFTPARAAAPQPVIVELFTSEGCVNCPPADELLRELDERQPVSEARVIVLGQHVDYWNRLGWTDPYSSADFTRRQEAYSRAAGAPSIFTPQVVVDGHLSMVGSDRAAVLDAIRRSARTPKAAVALEWLSHEDVSRLSVVLPASAETSGAGLHLAVIETGLGGSIGGGENAGRTLRHAPVARSLHLLGHTGEDGAFARTAFVDWDPDWKPDALRIVVFAQRDAGRVVAIGMIER